MNNNKPTFSRLFIFIFLFQFLHINSETIIEKIINNYSFNGIVFYYDKTITDTLNYEIGNIKGKINISQDSIISFFHTKDDKYYFKNKGNETEFMKNFHKENIDNYEDLLIILDVKSNICPIILLKNKQYIYKDNILIFYNNNEKYDSASVYINNDFLIDSVKIYKKNFLLMKTIYSEFEKFFPKLITNIDYFKNYKELILNYNINIY